MNKEENNETIVVIPVDERFKNGSLTERRNVFIAEFMGARVTTFTEKTHGMTFWNEDGVEGRSGSFPNGSTNYFGFDEGYNSSWSWLMTAWVKLRAILHDVIDTGDTETVSDLYNEIISAIGSGDIQYAFPKIVKGIKWANENK